MFGLCGDVELEEEVPVRRPKEALSKTWWSKNVSFAIMEDAVELTAEVLAPGVQMGLEHGEGPPSLPALEGRKRGPDCATCSFQVVG